MRSPASLARSARSADLGLLVLRIATSALMAKHGISKLERWDELTTGFSDPLGLGPAATLTLAVFSELVCSVAIAAGLFTRLAALFPLATMLVAALIVHADDPWGRKELPLLYAGCYAAIVLLGAGRWSLDHRLAGRSRDAGAAHEATARATRE